MDTAKPNGGARLPAWIASAISAAGVVVLSSWVPAIAAGDTFRWSTPWLPSLGVNLSFYIDGLSLLFALLIAGVGAFVLLYAASYLRDHPQLARFFLYLVSFELSMLGLVLADNLITLFVFWELTTVTSYLLVGFDHENPKARRNALQALFVTGAGGLALLAGFLVLHGITGTMEMSEILSQGDLVRDSEAYLPIFILVLLGAFTKSAQVPFHFWLPNAMSAPTPVSAYLHSATMVKAGIYLLARMHPVLSGTPEWIWTLTVFGAVTAVWASIVALRQTDLKTALAYTTVMALGTLTMFLGSEARVAIAAAITFLFVHSLYKCALFLMVGIIDHRTGTREMSSLGGLMRAMPVTAFAAAAAGFSMAGFPPFLGFIGKELKYEGALAVASEPALVVAAAVLANAMMVAVAAKVALRPFVGQRLETPKSPREAPPAMWVGPLALGGLGLFFGLVPPIIGQNLIQPAVVAVLGEPHAVKLALWHGLNVPLLLSILTLFLGIVFYWQRHTVRDTLAWAETRLPVRGDPAYDKFMDGIAALCAWQTRILQGGSLTRYLLIIFAALIVAPGFTLVLRDGLVWPDAWPDLPAHEWMVLALAVGGTLIIILTHSRLAAICGLGVVGVSVALIFLFYGATDVAMTQLLVEVLFVVIIAVVLLRLPPLSRAAMPARKRWINGAVAVGAGAVIAALVLAVIDTPLSQHLSDFFAVHSVPGGHGRNIVNVILVDFRALDTLGEIVVVVVAGLAAFGLLKLRAGGGEGTS